MTANRIAAILFAVLGAAASFAPTQTSAMGSRNKMCGSAAAIQCSPEQFCELPAGQCGSDNRAGACLEKPKFCTREYRPVCGCDGKTYANDCERRAAGASLEREGQC